MEIKIGQHFYRDDYSVAIANIRQMLDPDTGDEFVMTDTVIFIDDMVYRYHAIKTEDPPTRAHLTHYMNIIVPEIFAHDAH